MLSSPIAAGSFKPAKKTVFVTDLERGNRITKGGLVLLDDVGKDHGLRDRWAKVWDIGADVDDVKPGEWVLIKQGRWTTGIDFDFGRGEIVRMWRIEYPDSILLVSDTDPRDSVV